MYSIGVDIGGSHIATCVYNHTDKCLLRETWVNRKIDSKASKNVIIQQWVATISKSIELAGRTIEGVGIAMPGPFNYAEGVSLIYGVDKLQALYRVNIRKELAQKLEMEASKIRFINDASAFSIAETTMGRAATYPRVVALTLGTGFGSSFLLNRQPLINAVGVPDGGFLYNQLCQGKLADDVFSTRGIIGHYQKTSQHVVKNVRELCERVDLDEKARDVFHWFGEELGLFIKPYLHDFESDVLVLGGNISKAHPYFMKDLSSQLPQTIIYISELGEEAPVIGGALLLEDGFYQKLMPTLQQM